MKAIKPSGGLLQQDVIVLAISLHTLVQLFSFVNRVQEIPECLETLFMRTRICNYKVVSSIKASS